jgi:hypothetical protein
MRVPHDYYQMFRIRPNEQPKRGRVQMRVTCTCGHTELGFAHTGDAAFLRANDQLAKHIIRANKEAVQ